jgi:hypothetical protein
LVNWLQHHKLTGKTKLEKKYLHGYIRPYEKVSDSVTVNVHPLNSFSHTHVSYFTYTSLFVFQYDNELQKKTELQI